MIKIPMHGGLFALIDDDDYPLVAGSTWHRNSHGYPTAKIGQKTKTLHRVLLTASAGFEIDHINRNKLDNRRANLRFVTRSQNLANRVMKNTKLYRGILHRNQRGKWYWHAQIGVNCGKKHLGTFPSAILAAAAYNVAALKYYGKHATLNEIA